MSRALWVAAAAVAAGLPLVTANTYYLYVASSAGLLVIVTAGLNVLAGLTGQISLGHAGFYAIGAYAAAIAGKSLGWPLPLAALAGIALAAALGTLVAAAALRVSGPYLAMVTIAFGIIVEGVLVEWVGLTGGPGGIFDIPRPPLQRGYWVVMAAAAAALALAANLRRSAWGRAFLAVKGSEVAAESLGLSPYRVRIVAFTVSAAFAGAAGSLFTILNGYVSPDSFTLQTSIVFLLALLFGGLGSAAGPLVGSLVLTLLPEMLTGLTDYRLILYGGLLLVSIYWLPGGVAGAFRSRAAAPPEKTIGGRTAATGPGRAAPGAHPRGVMAASGGPDVDVPILSVEGARLAFGGVVALADVSLAIPPRGIHAVIGPNGAGKTSLLNILSGYCAPQSGRVLVAGRPVTGEGPCAIARRGVARTFQTAQLFPDLTAAENVAVGLAGARLGSLAGALLGLPATRRREREIRARALELLRASDLGDWADRPAEALPAGLQRRLEVARALATEPAVLMLDEPAAGLGPAEVARLDRQLTALADRGGPAIVLVEHHMELVMAVSERVSVLDYGRLIASGTPEAVRQDPAVVTAYLGAPG